MSAAIEIKKLGIGDAATARSLILMFGDDRVNNEGFTLPSAEYTAAMLARADFHVIVALDGEDLVGGLTAYEMQMFKRPTTEMFLYEIEVAEPYRQRGIGKALIEKLIQICREKQIAEMFVGTEKHNRAARKLYESSGGVPDEDSVWFNYAFD